MNNDIQYLIEAVCDANIVKAQEQVEVILEKKATSAKDERFKTAMRNKLNARRVKLLELPYNLSHMLLAEDMTDFPSERFLLRKEEASIVKHVIDTHEAAGQLADMGISYLPTVLLHGESGTGKTMLARYIAHKASLPFIYVQFSALIDSKLGETGGNLHKIFEHVRKSPCVLCIDEIDAIGMCRSGGRDGAGGEMGRVVIGLMQELDRCPNFVILIGTTNRIDAIDPALLNRFTMVHEVKPLAQGDIALVADKFFKYAKIAPSEPIESWCDARFRVGVSTREIIHACTAFIVAELIENRRELRQP